MSRAAFQKHGLPGFAFPPQAKDQCEPVFHTSAEFDYPLPCEAVKQTVHVVVNNNPREALFCMARADVLVTSFSTLGWFAAVLSTGLVFHPDASHYHHLGAHR